MTEILSSTAVEEVLKSVLFKDDEIVDGKPPADAVLVDGLINPFAFHPGRLKEAAPKIAAMLAELPPQFNAKTGGGWSFLNGAMDKNDRQWGEQRDVDRLVCLGIGVGKAAWIMREMMSVLPGGVPYFQVDPENEAIAA